MIWGNDIVYVALGTVRGSSLIGPSEFRRGLPGDEPLLHIGMEISMTPGVYGGGLECLEFST